MKIYKSQYYILEEKRKDSFGSWISKPFRYIVTGYKAQHERCNIVSRFIPTFMTIPHPEYRLENGRMPEHQPIVSIRKALLWLDENKFQKVAILS